jgi:hypothetical protein
MFPEFIFNPSDPPTEAAHAKPMSPEEKERLKVMMSRVLKPEEHQRLEFLLLDRLKQHKARLVEMLTVMSAHWTYEDYFYRYYHGSFKVYAVQTTTERAAKLLRALLPERECNLSFAKIIRDGTAKEFELEHNNNWDHHTRPMLEAFAHAKFMVEMAVRSADLPAPPQPMPSGWAALLYLYDLR